MGITEKEARNLLGLIFAMRLPGDPEKLDLDRFPVGNYIVFRDALKASFEDTRRHLESARSTIGRRGIEPVFMMDEEGGRVTQISDFFPSAPSAAAVSRCLEPAEARVLYGYMSDALAGLGVDVNLAPCVDVNTATVNPIIGCRAFGGDRERVGQYGSAFVEATRGRTSCVAKHFPGHGMTVVDSHIDLPSVETPREDLEAVHIHPFRAAVRAGADGIMISHCHYDAFEAGPLPASLSNTIVGDVLRRGLGFDGLVMTDSLDMEAVTGRWGPAESSRRALSAGADMLLYTDNSPRFEEAFEGLTADLVNGRLDRAGLAESISRRQALLERISSARAPQGDVSRERYLELRDRVMTSAVRVEDPRGLLPLEDAALVFAATDPDFPEKARPYSKGLERLGGAEEAAGRSLVLWLMEPLRRGYAPETVRRMAEASRISVLVTSYPAVADALKICDARIVTDDTSPETQAAIMRRLFESAGGAKPVAP